MTQLPYTIKAVKNVLFVCCLLAIGTLTGLAQETSEPEKKWNFSVDANNYIFSDDFILMPIFRADKNKLHLEARYNYEDIETFSFWAGYNFMGGKNLTYTITPMAGVLAGNLKGVSAGLEMTFGWKDFELYTESEFVFDSEGQENNFFYNWTDVTWSPKDWLWIGISGQRTRLYQTELDIQRGALVGVGNDRLALSAYVYNLGFDDPFVLITASVNF